MARAAAILERWLLPLVLAVGVVGLVAPAAARTAVEHHGIPAALVVLVAAVGLGLGPSALTQARGSAGRVVLAVLVAAVVLPVLAWLASRLVPDGPLRYGVLAAGVAPSEVAAVALVGLAGGRAAVAASVLVGSTVLSVVTAGPVLHLLAGPARTASGSGLLIQLVRVVVVPLLLGALVRAHTPRRLEPLADATSAAVGATAVLVLIWLVAGQARLGTGYLRVAAALMLYLLAATALGAALGRGLPRAAAVAVLLPVAMRDFAVAAGIATAAFGAPAAGPLGLYGVLVLLLGTGAARILPGTAGRSHGRLGP